MDAQIIGWNERGLLRNLDDVQELLQEHSPKVLCVQETCLKSKHTNFLQQYALFCKDRDDAFASSRAVAVIFTKHSVSSFTATNVPWSSGSSSCSPKQTHYHLLALHTPSLPLAQARISILRWIARAVSCSWQFQCTCWVTFTAMRKAFWWRTFSFWLAHVYWIEMNLRFIASWTRLVHSYTWALLVPPFYLILAGTVLETPVMEWPLSHTAESAKRKRISTTGGRLTQQIGRSSKVLLVSRGLTCLPWELILLFSISLLL